METRRFDLLPWALGAAACLFYLSIHSTFYNFDGVACAIAVDLGDFAHLTHGNHLAYGLAGWLFHRLWQAFGYGGPALLSLQTLDCLLGGAGIGLFCAVLLRLRFQRERAALAAWGLAISQAYWLWSLEAQVYILGAFFLLLAAGELAAEKPPPGRLAFFHAAAVLGHVGNAMFLPVALHRLWSGPRPRRPLLIYTLLLGAILAASYLLVAALFVRPRSFDEWRVWLLGSAALMPDKSFIWYGGYSWGHLGDWAAMTLRIFADFAPLQGLARGAAWALDAAAIAAAAAGALALRDKRRGRLAGALILWLVSYAALFACWQPWTVVYRVTDLIALWMLIPLGLERANRAAGTALLAAWVLSAGIFNWRTNISPKTDPLNNKPYQEALWIGSVTPQRAWIVVTGQGQVYIPYFAHRRPLNMRYYDGYPGPLRRRLDGLAAAGEPVFISSSTLHADNWEGLLSDRGLELSARNGEMVLYRLSDRMKGKPSGSR